MARCEDFPCCGHYDEGGPSRGIPYCPDTNPATGKLAFRCVECGGHFPTGWTRSSMCPNCLWEYQHENGGFGRVGSEWDNNEDDGREYGCPDGAHEFMTLSRECGAMVCEDCGHHKSLNGRHDLVACYCGWSASGGDGRRELVEMGENIEEDW